MKKGLHLLNIIQFLAALNENLVKMLCALFVIHIVGSEDASEVVTSTGALFLLPFLLFSTLGGLLADKYSKSRIVRVTRLLELIAFGLFFLAIMVKSKEFAYILLFVLASISAIFSPSKYSIIPEYATKERLLSANSLITAFTFLGIILGTGLASLLIEITNLHFLLASGFAVVIALINYLLCFFLPYTAPKFEKRKIDAFFIKEFFISLDEMKRIPKLLPASLAFAYFLFIGSFLQLNLIPFVIESLDMTALMGGYFFTITAIGLVIGSAVTSKLLHGRINLLVIPYSGFALSAAMYVMAIVTSSIYVIAAMLLLAGFFAGFFLIPATTFVLISSPDKTRGRNFSTANFLSFFLALLAPLTIYILNVRLDLPAADSFIVIASINVLIMIGFLYSFRKEAKV